MRRYLLEIDQEGFPIFDGFRMDDEGTLQQLLGSIQRAVPGDLRSPLVTICEGEKFFVSAFSDPLVAQSVTLHGTASEWVFPGGRREKVTLDEIRVDEWNRFHAYIGPEQIPAVLSRKAQADFLNRVDLLNFRPGPWRCEIDEAQPGHHYWTGVYASGEIRWNMDEASPVLVAEWEALKSRISDPVLVPGAGYGHDANFLAQQGLAVTALDFSPLAEEGFRKKYPASSLHYSCEDVFKHLEDSSGHYGAIFEHTFIVAFDPLRRREYLRKVSSALKPGGIFFGVFLMRTTPPGPVNGAYGLSQWELQQLIGDGFDILDWRFAWNSHPKRLGNEMWIVLRKVA